MKHRTELLKRSIPAIDFLLDRQTVNGSWLDFDLEPGLSDSWVTAFVAIVLWRVRSTVEVEQRSRIDYAVKQAIAFLREHARVDNSGRPFWGYNNRVPPDSDSTAHVALLFHATHQPDALSAAQSLLTFRRSDGGIATFERQRDDDRWGQSHPDVTAVALRALMRVLPANDVRLAEGVAYLGRTRSSNGLWPSYWWNTPLFGTSAVLRALRDAGVATDHASSRAEPDATSVSTTPDALTTALQLSIIRLTGGDATREAQLTTDLFDVQLPDGSWPSAPHLRVTNPMQPGAESTLSGPLGADQNRLYTSASVVHALLANNDRSSTSIKSGEK